MIKNEENIKGVKSILALPVVYNIFQNVTGGKNARRYIVENYIPKNEKLKILDIGCGTGYITEYLSSSVEYHGYDLSSVYIEYANSKYGKDHSFYHERVNKMQLEEKEKYDLVIATGLIHHLSDSEAIKLFEIAHTVLKDGGGFLTLDGVYTDTQSSLRRFILSKDRGKFVRTEREYMNLARNYFSEINSEINENLFVIPYTACILNCKKSK